MKYIKLFFENKKIYTFSVAAIMFIMWFLSFIFIKNEIDVVVLENIEFSIIGLAVLLEMFFFEDVFYEIVIVLFTPFVFAHSLTPNNISICLYIAVILALIGIVIHIIKYKTKLNKGKMYIGLALFAFSFIPGGLFVKDNPYYELQVIFSVLVVGLLLFTYFLLLSYLTKPSFKDICNLMNALAIILILQVLVYYMLYHADLGYKSLTVGWGVGNNVSLMLLLTMPFSFYYFVFSERKYDFAYVALTLAEYAIIVISFSKGCMLIGALGLIFMAIYTYKKLKKNALKQLYITLGFLLVGLIATFIIDDFWQTFYTNVIENLWENIGFSNGGKRFAIYKDFFASSMKHPIFGNGLLYPLYHSVETVAGEEYQFGHNTFLHDLFTLGLFGVLCLSVHMFEKYYGLIKSFNTEKLIVLLAYVLSGLYGLIDVSYFFINYMIVIILLFVLTDEYIEKFDYIALKEKIKNLYNKITKKNKASES